MNCPGTDEVSCNWSASAGTREEKLEARVSEGCTMCGGCPPLSPEEIESEPDDDEVHDLLTVIEDMAMWAHADSPPDFEQYPFEISRLYRQWRESEQEIRSTREHRFAIYIKHKFEK